MPRLAIPAKEERRRREPPTERDRFLFSLKVATFVVATASVGVILLLDGGGGDDRADPAVPTITVPSDTPVAGRLEPRPDPTTTSPSPTIVAPPVERTETTEIVPAPKPPAPKPPGQTRPRPPARFVVAGTPCKKPGSYALTAKYEPVVCERDARADRPTWQLLF
ncbi:MAG: hypothetical protein GEV28_40200 [Actinophytocola sp.]|uniref:hypothetical protein n=1 Tax=Actinophytocola sp. TaxID=1872138 RepID=UPI0013296029|nr:hypothetical protein [Actinophytocola sp.]MPZ86264.1 hypothetical protein [Actinophytocola sp.]